MYLAGLVPAVFLFLTFLFPGKNVYFTIHDNLEAEAVIRTMMARDNATTPGDGMVQQVMNGIPRVCMQSDLHISSMLYNIFNPFTAYLVNLGLLLWLAYTGMWLLLRKSLIPGSPAWLAAAVAACFSVLPLYPGYGLSVAGLPLLLLAFIWIHERRQLKSAASIIVLFLFWSSFYLVGIFILALLGVALLIILIRKRKIHLPLLLTMILMGLGYFGVEYRIMLETFFFKSFESHRVEFAAPATIGFRDALGSSLTYLREGFYHAPPQQHWLIIPVALMSAAGLWLWFRKKATAEWKWLVAVFIITVMLSVLTGFTHWTPMENVMGKISFFKQFNRERFFFLFPLPWYLMLGMVCAILWRHRIVKYAVPALLIFQCIWIFTHHPEFRQNMPRAMGKPLPKPVLNQFETYSWGSFMAEDLMQEIDSAIGQPKEDYRIACLGFNPAPAQYHGFFTLDFYNNYYRLDYKHQFRKIMAAELDKSDKNRKYFDEWGNRCYLFPAEDGDTLHHLSLNTQAFYEMGGRYILSHPFVVNDSANGLHLVHTWDDPRWPMRVHLYKVIP